MRRILSGVMVLLAALAMSSCAPRGIVVPAGSEDLALCNMRVLDAQTMDEIGEPGCDLHGSSVVLPDGTELPVGAMGAVHSQQFIGAGGAEGPEYLIVNWGVPGVGVSKTTEQRTVNWATSAAALDLQHQQLRL